MPVYGFDENNNRKEVHTKDKMDIVVLRGNLTFVMEGASASGSAEIDFPKGFTPDNCVAISLGVKNVSMNRGYGFGNDQLHYETMDTTAIIRGTLGKSVYFNNTSNKIIIKIQTNVGGTSSEGGTYNYEYKLVLMKYEVLDDEYTLGDVNQDGSITEADGDLVLEYTSGQAALTAQQVKAADIDKNGNPDALDAAKIKRYANGTLDTLE